MLIRLVCLVMARGKDQRKGFTETEYAQVLDVPTSNLAGHWWSTGTT